SRLRERSLRTGSEPEIGQSGMIVRPAAQRPAVLALGFGDRQVVDARVPAAHEAALIELPVLVAVGAEPGAAVIVPLVGEANRNTIAGERPYLLDQPVVELARPFSLEKGDDLRAAVDEFRAVAPAAVLRVGERHARGLTGVPPILGGAHLLRGRFGGEGRQRRAARHLKLRCNCSTTQGPP